MATILTRSGASDVESLLGPFAKMQPLDGRHLSVTVHADDAGVALSCVPDIPKATGIRIVVEGEADAERVTLSLARLLDMCRRVDGDLPLSVEDGLVTAGIWQTPELPERAFPSSFVDCWDVDAATFTKGLSATRYAASTDPVRPRLGIVHFAPGHIRACDGLRYHEQRTDLEITWDVPVHSALLVERLAAQSSDGRLRLLEAPGHQAYEIQGTTLVIPRPGAEFMDLDEIVAAPARAHNHHILRVERARLHQAIRDVAIMAGDSQAVRLDVAPGTLTVSATDGALNAGRVDLPCEWAGEARTLRFWVSPLVQLLRTSARELVELRLGTSTLRALTPMVVWEDSSFGLLNQIRGG